MKKHSLMDVPELVIAGLLTCLSCFKHCDVLGRLQKKKQKKTNNKVKPIYK